MRVTEREREREGGRESEVTEREREKTGSNITG